MKLTLRAFVLISLVVNFCGGGAAYAQSLTLELLTDPEPLVGYSESAPIQVRLSGEDRPIRDAVISFAPLSDMADTYLSALSDTTSADGLAGTTIMAGMETVDFDVRISARNYDVAPLMVHVRVASDAGLPEADYPGDFRSMQEAIDALADGGTLRIAKGIFPMEPTYIRGKTVHIRGGGSNCRNPGRSRSESNETVLVAPSYDRVTAPEDVNGSWHYIDAGGSMVDLRMTGGDAGLATRETREGASRPLTVSNVCLTDMVRGIHHKASAPLHVSDTVIKKVLWNAISFAPLEFLPDSGPSTIADLEIVDPENVCLYFENEVATVHDDYLVNCSNGGILAVNSALWVDETIIVNAGKTGISLVSSWAVLFDNILLGTNCIPSISDPEQCLAGDGVLAWDNSIVYMFESNIDSSDRSAVSNYGSYVEIGDNRFSCQTVDLVGEELFGNSFDYEDLLDNKCGCPLANGPCELSSGTVAPPAPVGGLE